LEEKSEVQFSLFTSANVVSEIKELTNFDSILFTHIF